MRVYPPNNLALSCPETEDKGLQNKTLQDSKVRVTKANQLNNEADLLRQNNLTN